MLGPVTQEPRKLPPAGWYPDPREKGQERYWAGTDWTDDVRAPQPRPLAVPADWDIPRTPQPPVVGVPPAPPGEFDPFRPLGLGQPPQPQQPQQPHARPEPGGASAPRGRRLASFGARLGATLIDYLIVQVLTVLAGIPIWIRNAPLAAEIVAEMEKATPDMDTIIALSQRIPVSDQITVIALTFGIWFVYAGVLLQFAGATLGHLLVGNRFVPAMDEYAKLPARTAWLRAFAWSLVWTASQVMVLAPLVVVVCLWMLWTPTRQTLVDLACRTKVVRRR